MTDNTDNQAIFVAGRPIRYADTVGNWRYGMVVNYNAGTVTLDGGEMDGDYDTFLEYGQPEMLRQINFYVAGALADGSTDFGPPSFWQMDTGYVVRATAKLKTAAGGADAHIEIEIAGSNLMSPAFIDLAQATDEVDSGVTIVTTAYDINFGEAVTIKIPQAGVAGTRGEDLLVTLQVIIP